MITVRVRVDAVLGKVGARFRMGALNVQVLVHVAVPDSVGAAGFR